MIGWLEEWGFAALGVALILVAALINRFAPAKRGRIRRALFLYAFFVMLLAVREVLIVMHHPPVADVQTVKLVDHNPRPNEQALAAYLKTAAAHSAARFVVSAGHIHNYERLSQDGVTYLVSGGGGATPYEVDRTPADLYQDTDFPNYHYVRFELRGKSFSGEMIRLQDFAARSANPRARTGGGRARA